MNSPRAIYRTGARFSANLPAYIPASPASRISSYCLQEIWVLWRLLQRWILCLCNLRGSCVLFCYHINDLAESFFYYPPRKDLFSWTLPSILHTNTTLVHKPKLNIILYIKYLNRVSNNFLTLCNILNIYLS